MDNLRFKLVPVNTQQYQLLKYHFSRQQNLTGAYRKSLNLSCSLPTYAGTGPYTLEGYNIPLPIDKVIWWATSPDKGTIFNSPSEAYLNTVNKGAISVLNSQFKLYFEYPSVYRENSKIVSPHIHVALCAENDVLKVITIELTKRQIQTKETLVWLIIFLIVCLVIIIILFSINNE